MVAERSQKDPKEYLPFLSHLQSLPPFLAKYTIDIQLQRWDKALRNISEGGESYFDKVLELSSRHSLYPLALELFPSSRDIISHNTLLREYGKYLLQSQSYSLGCDVLLSISPPLKEDIQLTLDCAMKSLDWKLVITLSYDLEYSDENRRDILLQLISSLKTANRNYDAAVILLEYINDIDEAITVSINVLLFTFQL